MAGWLARCVFIYITLITTRTTSDNLGRGCGSSASPDISCVFPNSDYGAPYVATEEILGSDGENVDRFQRNSAEISLESAYPPDLVYEDESANILDFLDSYEEERGRSTTTQISRTTPKRQSTTTQHSKITTKRTPTDQFLPNIALYDSESQMVHDDSPSLPLNAERPRIPRTTKPLLPQQWILGRHRNNKLNLMSWLIDGCLLDNASGISHVPTCTADTFQRAQEEEPSEIQTYDGFFNNVFKTDLGAVDTPMLRRVPPVYDDGVYLPATKNRINPIIASDELMNRIQNTCEDSKSKPCGSHTGKTALLVFFGQQLVEEILDAQRPGCPPEYFNIPIPPEHHYRTGRPGKKEIPVLRSRYSQSTGHSPNNPRQQLNEITPYFDGGLVYGTAKGWADVLRTFANGTLHPWGELASENDEGYFPVKNSVRLPLANPPPPARHCQWVQQHQTANVDRFFVLGNPRGNENAMLLTFGVVMFRWHNQFARYLHKTRPQWDGERIFNEARKWVIATHQQIVYYDWLPEWLGNPLPEYKGYDPSVDPQIEQFFQTAAMRFGHTLVTPGIYLRDYACADCDQIPFEGLHHSPDKKYKKGHDPTSPDSKKSVRTCNIFWRPQEPMTMMVNSELMSHCEGFSADKNFADVDRLLMGMASQRAEREDNMIVEDLRGNVFGPLEFSRRDLMAINIQRGRDHGTPDYNTARETFGLPRICSVDEFLNFNHLNESFISESDRVRDIRRVIEKLEEIHNVSSKNGPASGRHNCWGNIDVWTGGILETNMSGPGPLFRKIIEDQFMRIRSADRFWFENRQWKHPRFSNDQIDRIKKLKIFDMLVSVTDMLEEDIQSNPFSLPTEEFLAKNTRRNCEKVLKESACWKKNNNGSFREEGCFQLPQLHTEGNDVENCTHAGTYDYFSGSEIPFIITFAVLGVTVLGIGALAPCVTSLSQRKRSKELTKLQKHFISSFRVSGIQGPLIPAREWEGWNEGYRSVMLVLNKGVIEVRNTRGDILRNVDVNNRESVEIVLTNDGSHFVIKNPKEYDLVLNFETSLFRDSCLKVFKNTYEPAVKIQTSTAALKPSLSGAVTKVDRLKKLEKFYRVLFSHAFGAFEPAGKKELIDPRLIKSVIGTELTKAEFAAALGMRSESSFVQRMFDFIDGDNSGSISFREFLNLLIIFSSGNAGMKTELMFKMYDADGDGLLNQNEFKNMLRSLLEAVNAEVTEADVDSLVKSMRVEAKVEGESEISLEEFQRVFSQHQNILESAQLQFSGANVPEEAKSGMKTQHKSNRATLIDLYGDVKAKETTGDDSEVNLDVQVKSGQRSHWIKLLEQYRLQIFWCTLYTVVVVAVFAERSYYYSVEREHGGLRQIAGHGVTVTRGAASAMMFCYGTLLITMCRNTITKLRETFFHHYIPFDSFIPMHKYIACLALFFTTMHVIGHGINFYHISTQTASDLSCLFTEYFRSTHVLPKFHYWCFQTVTGISGILLVLQSALIYAFSTNYARQHAFQMFWGIHQSYPIFYVLMLVHGSGRLVQDPLFGNFLAGPLALFVVDRLITLSRKRVHIPVVKAEILPSNVTYLEFKRPAGFEFKSGQWVRIACQALNSSEFHPFTLSSAPHEKNLTLHIRAVGPWTINLRQLYEMYYYQNSHLKFPRIYLEGPYGEGHQDWWRYEVSVLIGGGIGVTPFASILKDVAHNQHFRNCKKIYFLWVTRTQKQFEWFVDIIREVEECKIVSAHVFITEIRNKFDLRSALVYTCERHFQKVNNRSLFTGLKSVTHFGRPNFTSFFKELRNSHGTVSKIGVFSCGSLPMVKEVDEACKSCNSDIDDSHVIFQHHFENF